jgi:hypothetical protein
MRLVILKSLVIALALAVFCVVRNRFVLAQSPSSLIGERPALEKHFNEADIENRLIGFNQLIEMGESIFAARWTKLDGQGRPAATGNGTPTKRDRSHDPGFLRTSGTDATSCADCHNQPTRKLWDVGNTAPYGHRGDLTTITEAILHHAGEARLARERFEALTKGQQAEIVEFLRQLQILPNGSPRKIREEDLRELLKIRKSVTVSVLPEWQDQP